MLRLRYFIRLIFAFLAKFKGVLLIGFLLGVLIFSLFSLFSDIFIGKKTEKIGITGRFHTENIPLPILNLIGEGLTAVTSDGTIIPKLASSWESPDKGKTWIFTLSDNRFWQDGEQVTSENIIYEFSDVEIEKPDAKTVAFKLKDPYSTFPSVVSRPTFKTGLLGTGNWKVEKISISGSFIESLTITDKNKNKRIYRFYPTEETTKLAYTLGEVDEVQEMFTSMPFESWKTLTLSEDTQKNKIVTIFFNNQDKLLSEKSLRQALVYAIDKSALPGERAISPIPSDSWGFNPLVKTYDYSHDRAVELIDELDSNLKENLNITLISSPILLDVAEQVAKYWTEVGVPTKVLVSSIVPIEFQAYLTMIDVPRDPDQYSFWHSTQAAGNISNYSNQRIDKLLEDGRVELNTEERKRIYLDFQRFLLEDSPAAFLYYPKTYTITRK